MKTQQIISALQAIEEWNEFTKLTAATTKNIINDKTRLKLFLLLYQRAAHPSDLVDHKTHGFEIKKTIPGGLDFNLSYKLNKIQPQHNLLTLTVTSAHCKDTNVLFNAENPTAYLVNCLPLFTDEQQRVILKKMGQGCDRTMQQEYLRQDIQQTITACQDIRHHARRNQDASPLKAITQQGKFAALINECNIYLEPTKNSYTIDAIIRGIKIRINLINFVLHNIVNHNVTAEGFELLPTQKPTSTETIRQAILNFQNVPLSDIHTEINNLKTDIPQMQKVYSDLAEKVLQLNTDNPVVFYSQTISQHDMHQQSMQEYMQPQENTQQPYTMSISEYMLQNTNHELENVFNQVEEQNKLLGIPSLKDFPATTEHRIIIAPEHVAMNNNLWPEHIYGKNWMQLYELKPLIPWHRLYHESIKMYLASLTQIKMYIRKDNELTAVIDQRTYYVTYNDNLQTVVITQEPDIHGNSVADIQLSICLENNIPKIAITCTAIINKAIKCLDQLMMLYNNDQALSARVFQPIKNILLADADPIPETKTMWSQWSQPQKKHKKKRRHKKPQSLPIKSSNTNEIALCKNIVVVANEIMNRSEQIKLLEQSHAAKINPSHMAKLSPIKLDSEHLTARKLINKTLIIHKLTIAIKELFAFKLRLDRSNIKQQELLQMESQSQQNLSTKPISIQTQTPIIITNTAATQTIANELGEAKNITKRLQDENHLLLNLNASIEYELREAQACHRDANKQYKLQAKQLNTTKQELNATQQELNAVKESPALSNHPHPKTTQPEVHNADTQTAVMTDTQQETASVLQRTQLELHNSNTQLEETTLKLQHALSEIEQLKARIETNNTSACHQTDQGPDSKSTDFIEEQYTIEQQVRHNTLQIQQLWSMCQQPAPFNPGMFALPPGVQSQPYINPNNAYTGNPYGHS